MKIFTIGFTKKSAAVFFAKLRDSGVRRVFDTRLNNRSQLAGFTKAEDLRYFLDEIAGIEYKHLPALAPTEELLARYKKDSGSWQEYASQFVSLISSRHVEGLLSHEDLDMCCFLCSEHLPTHCHRRLVAEYFQDRIPEAEIVHLI